MIFLNVCLMRSFNLKELQQEHGQHDKIWRHLDTVLQQQPFQRLCHALLPYFDDAELLAFAQGILQPLSSNNLKGVLLSHRQKGNAPD